MKARVSELEAELAEEKAAGERRMARAKEEETELLKSCARSGSKAERELGWKLGWRRREEARARADRGFARRVQHAGLVKAGRRGVGSGGS